MAGFGSRLPAQKIVEDEIRFLTHDVIPKTLDTQIRLNHVMPNTGIYKHFVPRSISFYDALRGTEMREYTLSGAGSIFDYDTYGRMIHKPRPQYATSGCNTNSLCVEPTCFGMVEGVRESNNVIYSICWELALSCLKDLYYSDRFFEEKMQNYLSLFLQQPAAVFEAFQRTFLLRNAIKVVCVNGLVDFTGSILGGVDGIKLPFHINLNDPYALPDLNQVPYSLGGVHFDALYNQLVPAFMQGDSFTSGGAESFKTYAYLNDFDRAVNQTMAALGKNIDVMSMLKAYGVSAGNTDYTNKFGLVEDNLFPTFYSSSGLVNLTPYDTLSDATLYGYVLKRDPQHGMNKIRGMLIVPDSYKFVPVQPPKDDFSDLGLGNGLAFGTTTPGVTPLLSTSMFVRNKMSGNSVKLGGTVKDGMIVPSAKGLTRRDTPLTEIVRTYLTKTYSSLTCGTDGNGMNRVGSNLVPQSIADGFMLKSMVNIGTQIKGDARPILVLWATDDAISIQPIVACNTVPLTLTEQEGYVGVSCCPGGKIYAILTFSSDAVAADFSVNDEAIYRTGDNATAYEVTVTAVDGNVVTVESTDGVTPLPCCKGGSKDDYGNRFSLMNVTTATATSSNIVEYSYDVGTSVLSLELSEPLVANVAATPGTITLRDGQVINVVLSADSAGILVQVEAAGGETCDLSALDCPILRDAIFSY